MAKGAIITDEVRTVIAKAFLKHPEGRAKEIREEVNNLLRKQNPRISPNWPGLSIVQKELTKIRRKYAETSSESKAIDKYWTTQSLKRYPIPPEALPAVLKVSVYARKNLKVQFSIREAQWVGRFYAITEEIPLLYIFARGHAYIEAVEQISGCNIDSLFVDIEMFGLLIGQKVTPKLRKAVLQVRDDWPKINEIEEYLRETGVYEMLDKGYTFEEINQVIKEAKHERSHSQER